MTYCALVWFLPSMPPHVYNQHVLGFERFLLSTTLRPATYKCLLVRLYMILVDMLEIQCKVFAFQLLLIVKTHHKKLRDTKTHSSLTTTSNYATAISVANNHSVALAA